MRWIDHIYLAHRSFWDIQQKKDMSNFFKRLLAIRQDLVSRAGSIDGASAWLQDCVKGVDSLLFLRRTIHLGQRLIDSLGLRRFGA